MSKITLFVVAIFAALVSHIDAECANACNGHGKCVGYDMCICNRNWQANDCSERVCMHGLAHVDTPKGDLDMSGSIAKPSVAVVVDNSFQYPYGTTEQFPAMEDSDLNILPQSAHYYMECSNKGTCDRDTGLCECFDGYDGVACQRASCPGYPASCSGHGVCKSASQLAGADSGNVYKLWNKDATMGCECDAGYFGPDCSERKCKVGVDPLYLDDSSTVKYSAFDFATLTTAATADFDDGHPQQGTGYWAIRFFDHSGEDWVTEKIAAGADCATVKKALYGIPNDVIPAGTLYCTKTERATYEDDSGSATGGWNHGFEDKTTVSGDVDYSIHAATHGNYFINYQMSIWDSYIYGAKAGAGSDPLSANTDLGNNIFGPTMWIPGSFITSGTREKLSGYIYRIKFHGNPGKLRQPEIVTHLDGKRNSLMSTVFSGSSPVPSTSEAVITKVWTDGQQGEDKDYFADHCDGVTVGINSDDTDGGTQADKKFSEITSTGKFFHLIPGRMTYATTGTAWVANADESMVKLLKKCLGDSDATSTNNVDIYDWDHGSDDYPHLIKLVRSVTSATDGGYYAAIIFVQHATPGFSATGGTGYDFFKILNPFIPPDAVQGDTYEVYTTKGTLSRVSRKAVAHFGFGQNKVVTTHTEKTAAGNAAKWDGDLSCEVGANNGFRVSPSIYVKTVFGASLATMTPATIGHNGDTADVFINDVITEFTYDYSSEPHQRTASTHYKNCLNKTDIVTFLNPTNVAHNPQHLNLYTIERLVKDLAVHSNIVKFLAVTVTGQVGAVGNDGIVGNTGSPTFTPMKYGTNVITLDLATNWGTDLGASAATTIAAAGATYVYKFVPAAASTYEYVAECSNRGLCDRDTGSCTCFAGYTSDNCHEQSSLAL